MIKEKNVGILTFHRAVNFGAVLQTWALCKFLNKRSINAKVIDYNCEYMEQVYKVFSYKKFKSLSWRGKCTYPFTRIKNALSIYRRGKLFEKFITNEIPLLPIDFTNCLDICIVGSDQVWNPQLTGGLDEMYLLESPLFYNKKKISYAASSEPSCLNDDDIETIQKTIKGFAAVSVREASLKKLLSNTRLQVCVDPTFLISEEEYEEIISDRLISEPYLFVFQVVKSKTTIKIAKKIASERNLKLVYLNARYDIFGKISNLNYDVGPKEFLSLLKYASFVITTSFHGTALSIIFKKQFLFVRTGKSNRQLTLLKDLNLSERIIKEGKGIEKKILDIDFDILDINRYTDKSKSFLINSL